MQQLERFLSTSPEDVGCAETRRLLHVYAETIHGSPAPGIRYPGVAAHLRDCPPCADELEGLLTAITEPGR